MTESTILYSGMFCFAMVILGVTLTIVEFRKMSGSPTKPLKVKEAVSRVVTVAGVSAPRNDVPNDSSSQKAGRA